MSNALQNHVGIGKESTYGTPVSPTAFLNVKEVKGMSIDMDKKFIEHIDGNAAKNKGAHNGLAVMNGEYEMDLRPNNIGHIFASALGAPSSALASGESVVYEHTYTESFTKKSYTVEEKFGEIVKRHAGYTVKGFSIEGKKGETIMAKFNGMAQSQANASAATPSYETPRPWNFADVSALTLGGTNILALCDEFSLEYDNGLAARHSIGDNYPKIMIPGKSEFKGKLSLYLDTNTKAYLEDYIANTERALSITITGAAIGSASYNKLKIDIAKAQFSSVAEEISDNYNLLDIDFEAVQDSSSGIIGVVLTNLITAY